MALAGPPLHVTAEARVRFEMEARIVRREPSFGHTRPSRSPLCQHARDTCARWN